MRQNNSFLPDNYETPKGKSNYMKFEQGDNRFRILSSPIVGWEDWDNKTPVRFTVDNKPEPINPDRAVKFFWAMIVFNYFANEIQVLQITQKGIIGAIEKLAKDEDWGSPSGYDIKVTRKGEGMDTEYTVNPVPHKPLSADVIQAFNDKPVYLPSLFEGEDPFKKGDNKTNLLD